MLDEPATAEEAEACSISEGLLDSGDVPLAADAELVKIADEAETDACELSDNAASSGSAWNHGKGISQTHATVYETYKIVLGQ